MNSNQIVTALVLMSFFAFTAADCNHDKQESIVNDVNNAEKLSDFIELSIHRTPCFGTCPTYKANFNSNGELKYEGIRFVDSVGHFTGELAKNQIEFIYAVANRIGFYEFEDEYPTGDVVPTDLPKTIIGIKTSAQTKQIIDRNYQSPKDLTLFGRMVDSVINTVKLRRVDNIDTNEH